jgi:hypothetical protein
LGVPGNVSTHRARLNAPAALQVGGRRAYDPANRQKDNGTVIGTPKPFRGA